MDQAFTYIKQNNGIDTEDSYPVNRTICFYFFINSPLIFNTFFDFFLQYAAVDQTCKFDRINVGATDSGFIDVKKKDENALQQAIDTVGPVSVAIDASQPSFQFYSTGLYYDRACR